MNKLLADLNVLYVKVHNYHYNVVGVEFMPTHLHLEEEYNTLHMMIDEVAEQIKINGDYPKASMKEYLELTSVKEVESKDYSVKEILKSMFEDYSMLLEEIVELKKDQNTLTVNLLEGYEEQLSKKLWFYRSMMK